MSDFSRNLSRLRAKKKLTQEELATRVGITQAAIGQYEKGAASPKISIAVLLAKTLGVSVEELYGGSEEENDIRTEDL
jgi:transcriptional regulator with XRE-family HTH domain